MFNSSPTFLKAFVIEIPANIVGIIPILLIIFSSTLTNFVPLSTNDLRKSFSNTALDNDSNADLKVSTCQFVN